ncbi:MAG: hypothetical protein HUU16_02060 [Candidatus Omnitrophica bacterium]|nr:hypothetical protein [Candidatus Omnitrophota bacterium]
MVSFPGPWAFQLRRPHLILVSDQELRDLADPDKAINLSLSRTPRMESLRDVCKQAQSQGARTLIVAFDHFFSQYRPGQGLKPRTLTPDRDEYIQRIAALGKFAGEHGLGLELSLLSPLEIGPAYQEATGESGIWMQYRKGLRNPATGAFSVQMWRQKKWENNKGTIALADAGIRVFAFREEGVRGTLYRAVDPKGIVEISEGVNVESLGEKGEQLERVRIFGTGHTEVGALDKVLVVQVYRSPEMDYFSDKALPYLTGLVDRYADAGVKLNGLYSDEMHIQQDWHYFRHHDHGEFTQRYVSPGLAQRYAEKYGDEYLDFAKYLLYFTTGQEDFAPDLSAKGEVSHVFGSTPEDIRRTALFRARYYHLLQDGVVDLFVGAKRHAEKRMGHRLEARAHATWAESPTIDSWNVGEEPLPPHQYEYTPNFVWSNTVHQAASACFDIFKWGDFLTGNGNDHAEGGWIDRDYYAHALACSTGLLNEVPYSYAAHWGMPGEISHRRSHINNAFGSAGSPVFGLVQGMRHRRVEVLMLYPLDLVAAEERFGSWMTQYGYADMVTQAKLLERGKVVEGAIELGGNRFTTLAAAFEPFPSQALLEMMAAFARGGGRLIWSGPPPVLTFEGGDALSAWTDLFGVDYAPARNEGRMAPGREITFGGPLQGVSPQTILTDFVVDSIYPVAPREGTEPIAHCRGSVIGTLRRTEKGTAVFLGYRPRDDQSKSLGYETRNWFEVLDTLGAHPPTGVFPETNDNPEHLSRTTDYLVCRFPNGAVSVARHFREYEEGWSGGFARNAEEDKRILESRPLPTDEIHLEDFKVDGHSVTYSGSGSMSFRVDSAGNLAAFAGYACDRVTVDGRTTVFADSKVPHIGWGPVEENRQVPNGAVFQCQVHGAGSIRLPASLIPEKAEFIAEGERLGSRSLAAPHQRDPSSVILEIPPQAAGRWIYAVPR